VAEKPRYWDVHRCAWVTHVGAPTEPPADESSPATTDPLDPAVPEQRPGITIATPLVAGTPD
jgi:hypothetical protein